MFLRVTIFLTSALSGQELDNRDKWSTVDDLSTICMEVVRQKTLEELKESLTALDSLTQDLLKSLRPNGVDWNPLGEQIFESRKVEILRAAFDIVENVPVQCGEDWEANLSRNIAEIDFSNFENFKSSYGLVRRTLALVERIIESKAQKKNLADRGVDYIVGEDVLCVGVRRRVLDATNEEV